MLLRQPDPENLTPVESDKESQTPCTPRPGSGMVPVMGGDSGHLVHGDLQVSKVARFSDSLE